MPRAAAVAAGVHTNSIRARKALRRLVVLTLFIFLMIGLLLIELRIHKAKHRLNPLSDNVLAADPLEPGEILPCPGEPVGRERCYVTGKPCSKTGQ
jgi:hypothetical protein